MSQMSQKRDASSISSSGSARPNESPVSLEEAFKRLETLKIEEVFDNKHTGKGFRINMPKHFIDPELGGEWPWCSSTPGLSKTGSNKATYDKKRHMSLNIDKHPRVQEFFTQLRLKLCNLIVERQKEFFTPDETGEPMTLKDVMRTFNKIVTSYPDKKKPGVVHWSLVGLVHPSCTKVIILDDFPPVGGGPPTDEQKKSGKLREGNFQKFRGQDLCGYFEIQKAPPENDLDTGFGAPMLPCIQYGMGYCGGQNGSVLGISVIFSTVVRAKKPPFAGAAKQTLGDALADMAMDAADVAPKSQTLMPCEVNDNDEQQHDADGQDGQDAQHEDDDKQAADNDDFYAGFTQQELEDTVSDISHGAQATADAAAEGDKVNEDESQPKGKRSRKRT